MRSSVRRLFVPGLALVLVACASSAKLARQSDEALARGDLRKAYDRARSAIEKDPQNQDARGAYAAASRLVKDLIRERVERGAAVILTTHILEVAERMADRIGIIKDGKLLTEGRLDELQAHAGAQGQSLEDVFLSLIAQPTAIAAQ